MTATAHYFKQVRAHQARVAASGGGSLTTYPSGRTERSYASAPYGEHALAAWASAKREVFFRAVLSARVKADKKRSASAKKAAKTRKANRTH